MMSPSTYYPIDVDVASRTTQDCNFSHRWLTQTVGFEATDEASAIKFQRHKFRQDARMKCDDCGTAGCKANRMEQVYLAICHRSRTLALIS